MDALINYFFSATETKPKETMDIDIAVCVTRNNEMTVYRLSNIKKITDRKDLYTIGHEIANHVAESFDQEEVNNGNIILDEIQRMLSDP